MNLANRLKPDRMRQHVRVDPAMQELQAVDSGPMLAKLG
jgi:hypothetical protein